MKRRFYRFFAVGLAIVVCAAPAWSLAQKRTRSPAARDKPAVVAAPKWDRAALDAFFSDARDHLGPGPAPGGAPSVGPPDQPAATSQSQPVQPSKTPGGPQWSKLITPSGLEDEVKAKGLSLAAAVATPTAFKGGGHKAAREDFSMLAIVFGVIAQHDAQVRWQKDAAGLRAAFSRAGFNCKAGTDNSFKEAKLRSQDLAELVRGGSVQVSPADAEAKWSEVANRPPLMKRMELAMRERLGPWTANAGDFARNRDAVIREAQLLAMIAEVIKDQGFEFADDSTYRAYVEELQKHCLEIVEAAQGGDFPNARSAASGVNQTCTKCHGDFRG